MPINKSSNQTGHAMFTSVSQRSASAYHRVGVETAVSQADPHQLVGLLFDRLLQTISIARSAMRNGQIATKGENLSKAIRVIDEGLKPALNMQQGGDIAANLNGLYGYCVARLAYANLRNDEKALDDVVRVIEPIADGWKKMATPPGGQH